LPAIGRSEGGDRLLDEESLQRLAFIRRLKTLGLSLEEIQGCLPVLRTGRSKGAVLMGASPCCVGSDSFGALKRAPCQNRRAPSEVAMVPVPLARLGPFRDETIKDFRGSTCRSSGSP